MGMVYITRARIGTCQLIFFLVPDRDLLLLAEFSRTMGGMARKIHKWTTQVVLPGSNGVLAAAAGFYKLGGTEKGLHTNVRPPCGYVHATVCHLCLSLVEDR